MPEKDNSTENLHTDIHIPDQMIFGFFRNGYIEDGEGSEIWRDGKLMQESYSVKEILFTTHISDNEYIGRGIIGYLFHKLGEIDYDIIQIGTTSDFVKKYITNIPARHQGIINCLSKSLIIISNIQDIDVQRDEFERFKNIIINDLYGYIYSFPQVLEVNGVARDCSIDHLIDECKKLQSQKRKQEIGEEFSEKVIGIFGMNHDTQKEHDVYVYMKGVYAEGGSPKYGELISLGVNPIIAQAISYGGTYSQIDSIVNPEPEILGEDKDFKLLELTRMKHLEEESEVTGHCVGESSYYYDKIQKGEIRIFSLRHKKSNNRFTIEIDTIGNIITQIEGNKKYRSSVRGKIIDKKSILSFLNLLGSTGVKVDFDYHNYEQLTGDYLEFNYNAPKGDRECIIARKETGDIYLYRFIGNSPDNFDTDEQLIDGDLTLTNDFSVKDIRYLQKQKLHITLSEDYVTDMDLFKRLSIALIRLKHRLSIYINTKYLDLSELISSDEDIIIDGNIEEICLNQLTSINGELRIGLDNPSYLHLPSLIDIQTLHVTGKPIHLEVPSLQNIKHIRVPKGSKVIIPQSLNITIEYT